MKNALKKLTLAFAGFLIFSALQAQKQEKPAYQEKQIKYPSGFGVTEPLRDIQPQVKKLHKKYRVVPNKFRRFKYVNANHLPKREDAALQKTKYRTPALTPLKSWQGMDFTSQQVAPPDPSGAPGKSHYVQMVNIAMQIFDKNGNSLWGPTSLSSVFPSSSSDGDPIVMYDKYADRWFISQFQTSTNEILIGISKTSDPTGAWYHYRYTMSEFPDYPKYSIWNNGYYMTSNSGSGNAVCFERDEMLKGNPSARMAALTVPDAETNGFFSAASANSEGDQLPPAGTPAYLFYFQDDGWASGSDRIKVWEMNVDWADPNSSSISLSQEIPVTPFNTDFNTNWNDISQPNTSQKLDAVPGAFMYMAPYRNFAKHNSLMLSHTVDIDLSSNIQAAVRWYELRQDKGSSKWTLYQEGTYGSGSDSRWMGSVAMDRQGNIGMAYSISSSSVFPSLKFTGRVPSDPLGTMTINESDAFTGTGSQTSGNRFGDYGHMTIDPVDNLTFWFTGEYMGTSGWKTGIFSFKIGEEYANDVSVVDIVEPLDGDLGATEKVKILIKNLGQNSASNFDVTIKMPSGALTKETFVGPLPAGDTAYYTFSSVFDFSTSGDYEVVSYSALAGDMDLNNDTTCKTIFSSFGNDVGVTKIVSPVTGVGLGTETPKVTLKNYGQNPASNFLVSYDLDGTTISDTYSGTLAPGATEDFTFTQTVSFPAVKSYQSIAYTAMTNDENLLNDTTKLLVEKKNCNPTSDCSFGDGFTLFKLGTINNSTGCSSSGYSDFTSMQTALEVGQNHTLNVQSGEDDQVLSVWIDYNDNLSFEVDELVITNQSFNSPGTFQINIPSNATKGVHILRARTHWDSNSDDPCVTYDYGETEDYKVDIGNTESVTDLGDKFNLNVFQSGDQVTVDIESSVSKDITYQVFNAVGQLIKNNIFSGSGKFDDSFSVVSFAKGIYYVKVSDGESQVVKEFFVR